MTTYLGIAHDNNFSLLDENVTVSDSNVYLLLTNGMVLACRDNIHGQLGIGINDEEDGAFDSVNVTVAIANLTNIALVFSFVDSKGSINAVGYDGSGTTGDDRSIVPTVIACTN